MGKEKRTNLSDKQKLDILNSLRDGKTTEQEVCRKYHVCPKTFARMRASETEIRKRIERHGNPRRKRQRKGVHPELDAILFDWFCHQRSKPGVNVSHEDLQDQMKVLAARRGIEGFAASPSWIRGWKARYNVSFRHRAGESASADVQAAASWVESMLPLL